MQTYSAPLRDMRFVLNELLDVGTLATLPGYEEATPDVIDRRDRGGREALREHAAAAQPFG